MQTLVKDINVSDWQISPSGFGQVITGEDDVLQSLRNILFTRIGDVPLNPFFGTNIHRYIDQPLNKSIPSIVSECTVAINKYEPRVKLKTVSGFYGDEGQIVFEITFDIIRSGQGLKYTFNLGDLKNTI